MLFTIHLTLKRKVLYRAIPRLPLCSSEKKKLQIHVHNAAYHL